MKEIIFINDEPLRAFQAVHFPWTLEQPFGEFKKAYLRGEYLLPAVEVDVKDPAREEEEAWNKLKEA